MNEPASSGLPLADTLISTAHEGILVIDANARTTFASERMAEMLGCIPSEIVGKPAAELFDDDTAEEDLEALRHGREGLSQWRLRRRDGSALWALVSATPLRDEQGNFHGALGMVTDVTALRKSEEEKSLILDSMTDCLTYLDPEFRVRYLNRAATATAHAVTEEPLGRYCYELRQGRTEPCPACPSLKTMQTGLPAEAERETPDGRHWHLRTFPVFGREGGVVGVAEFARDVTEAKQTAEALRERDGVIGAVLQASRNPVIVVRAVRDGAGRICDFEGVLGNPAAQALMGRCAGARLAAAHAGVETPDLVSLYARVVDSGEPATTEVRFGRHGRVRWFILSAVKVGDGAAITFTDITDQRQVELGAAERAEQVRQIQIAEAVHKLGAGLTHDLNGLLHCVFGYVDVAQRHLEQSHPARNALRYAGTAAQAAKALVRRLATMRRLSTFQPWPQSLNQIIGEYAEVIRCLVGERVPVELDLRATRDTVHGDRVELEQVLLNLCLNARDAMPHGGTITIATDDGPKISGGTGARLVRLSVSDAGCGIPSDTLPRVFEPFFTTKEPERGTGLGLSTVQAIVERHGGRIAIESVEGRGTKVTVLLPWWVG